MPSISRRDCLKSIVATAALSSLPIKTHANPLGLPIGCQTWAVREMIAKDFPGTLKMLSSIGFEAIELCSPVGYEQYGFGGLAKYSGAELRKIISDTGITCVSSHFGIDELRKDQPARIAWAKEVGLKQMIVPSLGGPKNPTLDDVKRAADEYFKMGELAAMSGIQQGLHNEEFELTKVNGKRTYDLLLELLDPKFIQFQFQVSTISEGYDAAEYLTKYPGHFFSMHVQGWNPQTRKYAAVGQDSLDWKKIFSAAKFAGIKNYFVEMNLDLMKASVPYLRSLQV
jgi:sugar phosphate isomerase/epimerase